MEERSYDLCIIGGGINGAGVARDAAGRGLSVLLIDAGDLGGVTSSASSKMLHGGLRYLEQFDFGLVKEALAERETVMKIAPHIARPMDFILPHSKGQRPQWMIKLGLFLYDHLAGRQLLKASKQLNLQEETYGKPLQEQFKNGFRYSDGWVDDARLVVLNAMSASELGAKVQTYTSCIHIDSEQDEGGKGRWNLLLENKFTGEKQTVHAEMVVNAAGPSANTVLVLEQKDVPDATAPGLRLVKGSHIVVQRLYEGDHGYLFQNHDKRVIFLWPFEGYTLVGTTDEDYEGNPREAKPSEEELDYLCAAVNAFCEQSISREDILYQFSGVRPLVASKKSNASTVSRRHMFHEHQGEGGVRMLSIYGGKLTTYRLIAEEVVDRLIGEKKHWTAGRPLPGGDIAEGDMEAFIEERIQRYPAFDKALVRRHAHAYGTYIDHILGVAKDIQGMGAHYGDDLYEAEVRYLIRREFVRTSRDILWRRSKLDLHLSDETKRNLEDALPDLLKEEGVIE